MSEARRFELRDADAVRAARARIRAIVERYRGEGRVFDAGGGDGATLPGESAIVLDMDPSLLRAAQEEGALTVSGDMQRLPVRDESVGQVLMCHTLEHCPDTAAALSEAGRILTPGGHAIIVVPNAASALARPRAGLGVPALQRRDHRGVPQAGERVHGIAIRTTPGRSRGCAWGERRSARRQAGGDRKTAALVCHRPSS